MDPKDMYNLKNDNSMKVVSRSSSFSFRKTPKSLFHFLFGASFLSQHFEDDLIYDPNYLVED